MKTSLKLLSGPVACLLVLLSLPGCQAIRKMATRPAPEEVTINSYTLLLEGYQETVTVSATAEELHDFLTGSNELVYRDIEFERIVPALGEDEVGLGTSIHYVYRRGLVVPARMIMIKVEGNELWYIPYDHPNFNFQRWRFEQAADGIRLTWESMAEVTDNLWTWFIDQVLTREYWYESQDMMMAQIQAHFDPAEDVEKLLSHGLRGEAYKIAMQVHETSVWIDAPPDKVGQSLNDPAVMSPVLGESENDCLSRTPPEDRTLYCPAMIGYQDRLTAIDNFGTDHSSEKERRRRYHQVALDMIGQLEIVYVPERKGTRLNAIWKWEIPETATPESMEQTIFIADAPEKLYEAAGRIKAGAESPP